MGRVLALSSKQLAYNWINVGSSPTMPTRFLNGSVSKLAKEMRCKRIATG